jgi:PAS domain S-box-containing protein
VQGYAILMLDPRGYVTTWNAGAERINGYAPHEMIGKPVSVFYPSGIDGVAKCERELRLAEQDGRYEEDDIRSYPDRRR